MSQRSSFFDSTAGDRTYDAANMARSLDAIVSDGVIAASGGLLQVTEQTPAIMGIKVALGEAFVLGYYFQVYNAAENIALAAANATNPRIDRIVVRRDLSNRTCVLAVVQGTPAASPAAPALTQNVSGVYELPLAQVRVNAAAASVTNANITDERMYSASSTGTRFDTALGHHHDGVDSRKATYADLLSIPTTFAPVAHAHASGAGNIVAYGTLSGIPATFAPTVHDHSNTAGGGPVPYSSLSGLPSTFAPAAHAASHASAGSDAVTVTYAQLTGKPSTFAPSSHAHSAADGTGQIAYSNLTSVPSTFAPSAHVASHKTGGGDALKSSDIGGFDRTASGGTIGTKIYVGTTTPASPAEGDIWIKA